MGAEATIQDWIQFESFCSTWSVPFATLLAEWLRSVSAGSRFGLSCPTSEAFCFVRDYVHGMLSAAAGTRLS
jgi:hypothetical protein